MQQYFGQSGYKFSKLLSKIKKFYKIDLVFLEVFLMPRYLFENRE